MISMMIRNCCGVDWLGAWVPRRILIALPKTLGAWGGWGPPNPRARETQSRFVSWPPEVSKVPPARREGLLGSKPSSVQLSVTI